MSVIRAVQKCMLRYLFEKLKVVWSGEKELYQDRISGGRRSWSGNSGHCLTMLFLLKTHAAEAINCLNAAIDIYTDMVRSCAGGSWSEMLHESCSLGNAICVLGGGGAPV